MNSRSPELYARFEQRTGPVMLVLAVLFVPFFLLSLVPDLPPRIGSLVETGSWAIWAAFVLEFAGRLYLAPDRRAMLKAHIFDLVIIVLPFLRVLRLFRGLRALRGVFRIAAVFGGTTAMGSALANARRLARKRGDQYVLLLVSLAVVAGAAIIVNVEADAPDGNIRTYGDGLWWAVSTVTTVGYGDRYPTTGEGRLVALVLMILGLGLFSVITGRVAAFFLSSDEGQSEVNSRLERIEQLLWERNSENLRSRSQASVNGGGDSSAAPFVSESSGTPKA
jgi:voltage-gated potassium channel